jgi:hypothetical protein
LPILFASAIERGSPWLVEVLGAFGVLGVLAAFVGLLDCRVEGPDEPVSTLVLFFLFLSICPPPVKPDFFTESGRALSTSIAPATNPTGPAKRVATRAAGAIRLIMLGLRASRGVTRSDGLTVIFCSDVGLSLMRGLGLGFSATEGFVSGFNLMRGLGLRASAGSTFILGDGADSPRLIKESRIGLGSLALFAAVAVSLEIICLIGAGNLALFAAVAFLSAAAFLFH